MSENRHKRQWRDYETETGARPVKRFISELDDADRVEVLAAMKDVRENGLVAARHLDGDIYEVRASGQDKIFRILFATEGRFSHVLLALEGFNKKTRKTRPAKVTLAKKRLSELRSRPK
ncbi:MAG: type II toxin-antitoxin system RelE/ParE family toxin [Myxococcales bacterium]|nr:type II toxin-antitoxin system RelE/ParE family toxin [Myxococcales bacterium]